MTDQSPIVAPLDKPKGTRWRIRVIRAGLSGNGNFYPPEVLNAAVPLFEGVRVFVKGDKEHLAGGGKDFRNLIGRLTEPAFVSIGGNKDEGEIQATLELLQSAGDVAAKVLEAWQRGMTDMFGFSIDAAAITKPAETAGRKVRECQKIDKVLSVDLIIEPGAGGQIVNLIEGKGTPMTDFLTTREITTLLGGYRLPHAAVKRLTEALKDRTDMTEADLDATVAKEKEYISRFSESGKVVGCGATSIIEARLACTSPSWPKNRAREGCPPTSLVLSGGAGRSRRCRRALMSGAEMELDGMGNQIEAAELCGATVLDSAATRLPEGGELRLVACTHPFSSRHIDQILPAGDTLAEMLKAVQPNLVLRRHARIFMCRVAACIRSAYMAGETPFDDDNHWLIEEPGPLAPIKIQRALSPKCALNSARKPRLPCRPRKT